MSESIPRYDDDDDDQSQDPKTTTTKTTTHFRALGHDRGKLFFITSRGRQVISFAYSRLSSKQTFMMLAPFSYWEREFSDGSGFASTAIDLAGNWLISLCYEQGVFRLDRMRGRGVWYDDNRLVIHAGDRLFVDGIDTGLSSFNSRYVYEALPALNIDISDPMPVTQSVRVLDFCESLNWDRPIYARMLAGWIAIAAACGAMPWRPHVFMTGPSGCGKSWVTTKIQALLGEFCISAKGETTEPGIRQMIRQDALPVTYDESEGEDRRTVSNIERMLGLMRQASAEVGGEVYKGGADGTAQGFSVRSMFLLSAIRVPMTQTADQNRVTVLTLRGNQPSDRDVFTETILPLAQEIESAEFGRKFRARVFVNLPTLRANVLTFTQAAGRRFGNQRIGDQVGPLLAGAHFLESDGLVTDQQADAIVRAQDWADQDVIADESDEHKCLGAILESHLQVQEDRTRLDLSVGELIAIASAEPLSRLAQDALIGAETARTALERHGVKVLGDYVVFSNTHRGMARMLRETAWGAGWGLILKRMEGASATMGRFYFAGAQSRGVKLPLESVMPAAHNEPETGK